MSRKGTHSYDKVKLCEKCHLPCCYHGNCINQECELVVRFDSCFVTYKGRTLPEQGKDKHK
jgi:hypothetical protein